MGRSASGDMQYLELHGGIYRVTVAVPKDVQDHLGKTRLKQSLATDSLAIANRLKWSVVAELKAQIAAAQGKSTTSPLVREALNVASLINKARSPQERRDLEDAIVIRAEEIEGPVLREEQTFPGHDAIAVHDPDREREARQYVDIAMGKATPIDAHFATYHGQQTTKSRTQADDVRSKDLLLNWCKRNTIPPTLEAITKKRAAQFMDDLRKQSAKKAPRTLNKYLMRLSAYWKWMEKRDHVSSNIWAGMTVPVPAETVDEQERAFRDHEFLALLNGNTTPSMHDLMRIAALTGARLEAVTDLKVGPCRRGVFRFKPQKKEKDGREVPIHSALASLVARRIEGKADTDDLFPEWPLPKNEGSQRERSFRPANEFVKYRRSVGVDEQLEGKRRGRVNFHSFRRWFITKAEAAGVAETTVASVVGHYRKGMTFGHYSKGPGMELLRSCVEAVKLPNGANESPASRAETTARRGPKRKLTPRL